jgi:hypothetical protein
MTAQTQYRFDRGLFTEMLENLNKDNRWYEGDFNIDDFLFQVRVRGIGDTKQPNLPSAYFDKTFKADVNMKQELVGQERYYTSSGQVWWYCKEFELDME